VSPRIAASTTMHAAAPTMPTPPDRLPDRLPDSAGDSAADQAANSTAGRTADSTADNAADNAADHRGEFRRIRTQRRLGAPPDTVYAAFAQADRLARWWGPRGFANTFHQFEFQPGGHWHFTMHGPNGADYRNHSVFTALQPGRLVQLRHESVPRFELQVTLQPDGHGETTLLQWCMTFDSADDCARVRPLAEPANEQNLDRLEVQLREMVGLQPD